MTSHRSLFWRSGIRFQRCTNNSASVRFCLSPAVASHRITLLRLQQGLTIPQDFLLKYPSSFHTSRTRRTLCTSLCDYSHKVWTLSRPKLCSFYFSIKKCWLFNVLKCLYNVFPEVHCWICVLLWHLFLLKITRLKCFLVFLWSQNVKYLPEGIRSCYYWRGGWGSTLWEWWICTSTGCWSRQCLFFHILGTYSPKKG